MFYELVTLQRGNDRIGKLTADLGHFFQSACGRIVDAEKSAQSVLAYERNQYNDLAAVDVEIFAVICLRIPEHAGITDNDWIAGLKMAEPVLQMRRAAHLDRLVFFRAAF